MDLRQYFADIQIHPANAMFALGVAILSFIVFHTLLALVRRRLCKLETSKADRPAAELLKATLARTSNLAIIATSILIGARRVFDELGVTMTPAATTVVMESEQGEQMKPVRSISLRR